MIYFATCSHTGTISYASLDLKPVHVVFIAMACHALVACASDDTTFLGSFKSLSPSARVTWRSRYCWRKMK